MIDFSMDKYYEMCSALLDSKYTVQPVCQYLKHRDNYGDNKIVILRHDIDSKPENAFKLALMESDLDIQSTYYFRYPNTFKPDIIKRISKLGHEIGYHYEVLSKTKGDYRKAINLFKKELGEFRKFTEINTICMHGSPLSKYNNRDLWKRYDFKTFDILGEAYLSVKDANYFSDTGRSWNGKYKLRDFIGDSYGDKATSVNTTNELIEVIRSKSIKRLYILMHPERWSVDRTEWLSNFIKDYTFCIGKNFLAWRRL